MKKAELIKAVATATNVSQHTVEAVIEATFNAISDEMKNGGSVRVVGFGTFSSRVRAERTAQNPRTGESLVLPASTIPVFKAGKELKELLK